METHYSASEMRIIRGAFFAALVSPLKRDGRITDIHIAAKLMACGSPRPIDDRAVQKWRSQGVPAWAQSVVRQLFEIPDNSEEARYLSGDDPWPGYRPRRNPSSEMASSKLAPASRISPSDAKLNTELTTALLRAVEYGYPDPRDNLPEVSRHSRRPARYAVPTYASPFEFVARTAELSSLNEWAIGELNESIFFLEAMGGTGKSMLAWHWMERFYGRNPAQFRGVVWYSFYELGSDFDDFVLHFLGYCSGTPPEYWRSMPHRTRRQVAFAEMTRRAYLIVLDGLERTLFAYQSNIRREGVEDFQSQIPSAGSNRKMFLPEDTSFLASLAKLEGSKILITSRLMPDALTNPAGLPLPGVKRFVLTGLDPAGAEALIRQCGVYGTSNIIQKQLKAICDNHPLVIGAIAKIVKTSHSYLGDFDSWVSSDDGLPSLMMSELNLVQRQSHILKNALLALSDDAGRLLSILSMLSWSASLEDIQRIFGGSARNADHPDSARRIRSAINELTQDGLLNFDQDNAVFDIHPVVRSVAEALLLDSDRKEIGSELIDYFSQKRDLPYDEITNITQLRGILEVINAQIAMGDIDGACFTFQVDLHDTLRCNLEQHNESIKIFNRIMSNDINKAFDNGGPLSDLQRNLFALDLISVGEIRLAAQIFSSLVDESVNGNWRDLPIELCNYANCLHELGYGNKAEYIFALSHKVADSIDHAQSVFVSGLDLFKVLYKRGKVSAAGKMWKRIDPMGRDWSLSVYRTGEAELRWLRWRERAGKAIASDFVKVEALVAEGVRNRKVKRKYLSLKGEFLLRTGDINGANVCFQKSLDMARTVSLTDVDTEIFYEISSHMLSSSNLHFQAVHNLAHNPLATHPILCEYLYKFGCNTEAIIVANRSLALHGNEEFGATDVLFQSRAQTIRSLIEGEY